MNSFLFKAFLVIIPLFPVKLWAQTGFASSHPLHPLQLLDHPFAQDPYLKLSYTSPFGVKSIKDFRINYYQRFKRGSIIGELQRIGIKDFGHYRLGIGYCLRIGDMNTTAVRLNSELLSAYISGGYKLKPGASLFSVFDISESLTINFFAINFTSLWFNASDKKSNTNLSLIAIYKSPQKINVILGLSCTKSFYPVFRAGVSIISDQSHTIIAGLQSGPTGFWLGYTYSMKNFEFSLSIQSSGIFGYEPGSSFKLYL